MGYWGITKLNGFLDLIFIIIFNLIFIPGPILGFLSAYFGWNAVLVLQVVLSLLAGITIYKAYCIETQLQSQERVGGSKEEGFLESKLPIP